MDTEKFRQYRKWVIGAEILLPLSGAMLMALLTKNMGAALAAAVMLGLGSVLTEVQRRLDDRYMVSIAADLSELCDSLVTLEERQLFPENEDSILSKLQSKVMKLVKILKKKNADAFQEQENIKALVSDISHQLKTPIANLKMYSEFLADDSLTEQKRREYVEIIQMSVERLIFLSESMIKLSRLESGLIHLHPEVQSLNETVLKAIKDVFVKARDKGVEITYAGEESVLVCHDKSWTAEAIFNLLDNAVKYSPSGSVVAVTIRRLGMFSAVEVADMALPIPEIERTKIFSRFYRGQNSRNTEGIGVGLYLAREIAVKQKGYLNLSCRETGNVFSIFLPGTKDVCSTQKIP